MEEIQMLDAVERYLHGEMNQEERAYFEELRKSNPDVDHLVVAHTMFLQQLGKYGEQKNFKAGLNEVHTDLVASGQIKEKAPQARIVDFFRKNKKVWAMAACIAGITALTISGMVAYLSPKAGNPSEIRQLYNQIKQVQNSQKIQNAEINNLKNSNRNVPIAPGKYDGTGFLIDGKGYLATSAHLVANADSVYVINNKGEYFKVSTLYVNPASDVAILKITDDRFGSYKSLPYAIKKTSGDLGEPVFTLGFPRNEIVYNQGYLSAKTGFNGDTMTCQIAISANPGNSGGPIFNHDGEVIGILSGKQITAEGVVFTSKASNIFKALEEIKSDSNSTGVIKVSGASSVKGLERVQQIKKIEDYIFMVKSY